jgi:phosphoenolpyruvate synthase/pyruvate phosphate dikinase
MSVLWLGDADCHDRGRVGGQPAYLSRLVASPAGHAIPPGFCLTAPEGVDPAGQLARAYAAFVSRRGVGEPAVAVRSSARDEDGALTSFAGQHET